MPFRKEQDSLDDLGYLLAEGSKNVVFVVGAGLSIPAGIPSWRSLTNFLLEKAEEEIQLRPISKDQKEELRLHLSSFTNPWMIGDEIARLIPKEKYIQLVRTSLSSDYIPPTYEAIWSLSPSGMVSYNLDFIAERAMGATLDQVATALDPQKFARFLLLSRPFLFQPHGRLAVPDSWVLGAAARNALLKNNQQYRRFVSSLLGSRRLVIIGFEPDDFAFESLLLDDFREPLLEGVGHFWITPVLTGEKRRWAELYNLLPIEYSPSTDNHDEVFDILAHLGTFRPRTPAAPMAYDGISISPVDLPSDDKLRSEPVEQIREKLNAALKGAIGDNLSDHDAQMEAIRALHANYSGSVHMAWHLMAGSDYGRVWGCKLKRKIGGGSFATVWEVVDPVDGSTMALKVLREETLDDLAFIEAFRRGVNAMKILQNQRVAGMVKFVRAYDVPACVFMEYVYGQTLQDALAARIIPDLEGALDIIAQVARIVNEAHSLKERVLHRDLKPSNVMLRGVYGSSEMEVVVLDFDLSWYEGAMGRSMVAGIMHNYAAPEQIKKHVTYSSRHTAVDVFGMGMLLYFVAVGRDPDLNAQNTTSFAAETAAEIGKKWGASPGVSECIMGIILDATRDTQRDRISLPSFMERVALVKAYLRTGIMPIPSDLALLEISAELDSTLWERKLDPVASEVKLLSRTSGATIKISFVSHRGEPRLGVELMYAADAHTRRSNVAKFLKTRSDQARAHLSKGGHLEVTANTLDAGSLSIQAVAVAAQPGQRAIREMATVIAEAASMVAFEDSP
jgi:eukaryotic-like serine/threonine-protein kinase